jgi:serine/threonine protein kinase
VGETSAFIFNAILEKAPVLATRLNPDLPGKLQDIIYRALEKDRELRYQSAKEMRAELLRLKRDTDSSRQNASSELRRGKGSSKRDKFSVGVISLIAVLLLAAAAYGIAKPTSCSSAKPKSSLISGVGCSQDA